MAKNQAAAATAMEVKFRGVRRRPWGRFVSEIREPKTKSRLWLGTFDSAVEAAEAYDRMAIALRGSYAKTNFLPVPKPQRSQPGVTYGLPAYVPPPSSCCSSTVETYSCPLLRRPHTALLFPVDSGFHSDSGSSPSVIDDDADHISRIEKPLPFDLNLLPPDDELPLDATVLRL